MWLCLQILKGDDIATSSNNRGSSTFSHIPVHRMGSPNWEASMRKISPAVAFSPQVTFFNRSEGGEIFEMFFGFS
jgi:hypothetical protein